MDNGIRTSGIMLCSKDRDFKNLVGRVDASMANTKAYSDLGEFHHLASGRYDAVKAMYGRLCQ